MIEENNIDKESLERNLANDSVELLEWPLLKKQLSSFAIYSYGQKINN